MKSYKCHQCGLTNWTTVEFCKRCQSPNPYFDQGFQDNNFDPANAQNFATAGVYRQNYSPDYSAPPPPNVFGTAVGTASANENYDYQNNSYENRPPIRNTSNSYSPETANKLAEAEKQIRNAWITGVIVCVVTTIIALLVSAAATANNIVPATPFEMMFGVVLFGGLTIGVYFKNRGCAIALCVLFILDKILTIADTGKLSGVFFTIILGYYFAYGIRGTFTYHKLKKQKV